MAVYRSDQALVTFAAEAAMGGYPELIDATAHGNTTTLSGAHAAGSRSLLLASVSTIAVGDFIRIGHEVAADKAGEYNSEIRRVTGVDGNRVYLDSPTGFHHITGVDVDEVTTATNAGIAAYPAVPSNSVIYGAALKFVPGIYETVDVPDMESTFTPTYALGSTAKRNATFMYKGEQSFNGSIPAFTVLNGWPLRFPIGKLTTVPSENASPTGTQLFDDSPVATWWKGDMVINVATTLYAALVVNDSTAASNRNLLYINHTGSQEIVQVAELVDATSFAVRLSHPLRFDHQSEASPGTTFTVDILDYTTSATETDRTFTHTITETADLDSIAMNVHMRDSGETAANDFDRRFYGGRIGTAVISGEETGRLTMSWDSMQFMGMNHNQQFDATFGAGLVQLPRYNMMQTISDTEAWIPPRKVNTEEPLGVDGEAGEPYLFSQGEITLFGVPIATIRSFSLTINNSPEARYYIGGRGGARIRGPYEIVNQRRDYSLTMTAVEPTSRASLAATQSVLYEDSLGSSIFKELLMEGDKSGLTGTSPEGLAFEIIMSRDGLGDAGTDYIKIEPDYASGSSPAYGLSKQGMFIQSAKYNLDGSSPIQADLDILLRSVKITVVDSNPIYP